jgi:succinyl-CoA synthetase beta subunit
LILYAQWLVPKFATCFFCQVTQSTDFAELANQEPWLSSTKLVVKPDMLFGKRGKSGLVALNLDLAQVRQFVKERLGVEVATKLTLPYFSNQSGNEYYF